MKKKLLFFFSIDIFAVYTMRPMISQGSVLGYQIQSSIIQQSQFASEPHFVAENEDQRPANSLFTPFIIGSGGTSPSIFFPNWGALMLRKDLDHQDFVNEDPQTFTNKNDRFSVLNKSSFIDMRSIFPGRNLVSDQNSTNEDHYPWQEMHSREKAMKNPMEKTVYYRYFRPKCIRNEIKRERENKSLSLNELKENTSVLEESVEKKIERKEKLKERISKTQRHIYRPAMIMAEEFFSFFMCCSATEIWLRDITPFLRATMKYGMPLFFGIPLLIGAGSHLLYKYQKSQFIDLCNDLKGEDDFIPVFEENLRQECSKESEGILSLSKWALTIERKVNVLLGRVKLSSEIEKGCNALLRRIKPSSKETL